eukprot:CAMPEP_0178946808 /NCGR_PEP_ID=MMETSP0789-20121207/4489_1 /TAXON_ID=3005 /ORGANISM="Rhizosolenia setigera, Strain CCMP 1694" /LENGTH=306 /DNA_ID=CAMNT_0020626837 /DNA_START=78 /DNA_END=998 /DNA_ORIENTATION=-
MKAALTAEAAAIAAAEEASMSAMDAAADALKEELAQQAFNDARDKGEKFAPDGTPIPENQNVEIRPLDPRFNPAFGNPFFRINNIEKKEEEIFESLSEKEKEFLLTLDEEDMDNLDEEEEEEDPGYEDIYYQFIVSEEKPRGVCGLSKEDAVDRCGSTCDPDVPTCLGLSTTESDRMLLINNQWHYQGACFEDVSCVGQPEIEAALEGEECAGKRINNPCPNPCDCHKSDKRKERCHAKCSSLNSKDILQCMKMRASGLKKREKKVLKAVLKQEDSPCEYNVHYVHPLLSFTELSAFELPGLFETF